MAICKMLRMTLLGVNSEEDKILDTLQQTGCVHVGKPECPEGFTPKEKDYTELKEKYERLRIATEFLSSKVSEIAKETKKDVDLYKSFTISFAEFMNQAEREKAVNPVLNRLDKLSENLLNNKSIKAKITVEKESYKPYINLDVAFSKFVDTKRTSVMLGTVPTSKFDDLEKFASETEGCQVENLAPSEQGVVIGVVCLKELVSSVTSKLYTLGFVNCSMRFDYTAKQKTDELNEQYAMLEDLDKQIYNEIFSLREHLRDFKILSDFYLYEIEKVQGGNDFARTNSTFLLQAYVPLGKEQEVEKALKEANGSVYTEFEEVKDGEFAPTLHKNNGVVRPFEFITNLYSPPKYGSMDPNPTMAFFFSAFMGFIMGDMGYGLLMAMAFLLAKGKPDKGTTRLMKVIGYGGIASIIFGAMFDSFFGYGLFRQLGLISKPLLPDPVADNSNLAGITIPTLLLLSLGFGVVQIMVSLVLKGILSARRGNFFDGICDGFIWVLFLGGLMTVVLDMLGVTKGLLKPAAIVTVASLLFAMVTAGRHEKFIGKFTKGFGAVYGIINYMSDILSYARLYGLMLSGAQIASIFTNLGLGMFGSGIGGILAGVLVLLVGHAFNLAMGALGAYIHDSRLQYIEYFGRFYEGEGVLFSPLGSKHEHVTVVNG